MINEVGLSIRTRVFRFQALCISILLGVTATAWNASSASAQPQWWEPLSLQSPESEVNVTGEPFTGTNSSGEVVGFIDAHTHLMSNIGFGGNQLCGATYSELGIEDALKDCDNHYPDGTFALLENLTNAHGGSPLATHDPVGWPTFVDWPSPASSTHQQMYYRWVERAWRGGQRIMVADAVNNNVLCSVPVQSNKASCDDMDTMRRQIQATKDLEAFIDNQYGGVGKGWFRIAYSAEQARSIIESGRLAVILGVEISGLFGCTITFGVSGCDEAKIDAGLNELMDLGVRSAFLCHKFNNALCGVRMDSGTTGILVNAGNLFSTGSWWETESCPGELHDNTPGSIGLPPELAALAASRVLPDYGTGPTCNKQGLSGLGEYALHGMMDRGMLVEVDHMSVKAASRTMDILEENHYPGVVSSHSWMDKHFTERLYRLGGFVTGYGGGSEGFINEAHEEQHLREEYGVGYGYGMDMNGFGAHPDGRADTNPTQYPFNSATGDATLTRQRTGDREWDINIDGLAHYGLVPDWLEEMRTHGGDDVVKQMLRGSESYLRALAAAQRFSARK
ncbi:MAG: hypothetical protein ACRCSF_11190 [Mycobacteriaceae bacterium]